MSESPDAEAELDRLLHECLDRPEDEWIAALEERCAAHPHHAAALRRRFGMLARLGMADASLDAAHAETVSGPATEPRALDLPGYDIGEVMGGGSMGVVYGGVRERDRQPVAVKVLHGHLLGSEGARHRFQREADLAGRVEHPNLCGVLEAGIRAGIPYLVMRRIRGISLKEWIPGQDRTVGDEVRTRDVLRWGEQVARALDAIHGSGLVHRDVKPGNIMVEGDGADSRAVLVDFGLAREEGTDRFTATGEIVGSPAYLSPEALSAAPGEPSQDIYALGATLFEALTGRLPFVAPTREGLFRAVLTGEVPSVGELAGMRARDGDLVLATAMAKEAGQRYQSAAAMASDLAALAEGRPVSVRAPGPVARMGRWFARHPVPAVGFAALALAFAVSLWAWSDAASARRRAESLALQHAAAGWVGKGRMQLARAAVARDPTPRALGALQAAVAAFRRGALGSVADALPGVPDGIRFAAGGWCVRVGDVELDARGGRAPAARGRDRRVDRGRGLEAHIEARSDVLVLAREGAPAVSVADFGFGRAAVAVDPRGRMVATAEGDGAVRLWTPEGALLQVLEVGSGSAATCVAFDAEGDRLVSASRDGSVHTWAVEPEGLWRWGEVLALAPTALGGAALALPSGAIVGCDADGSESWRQPLPGVAGLAGDGRRLVARDRSGVLWVLDGDGGGEPRAWSNAAAGAAPPLDAPLAIGEGGVAAVVDSESRTLWLARAEDGASRWAAPSPITALAVGSGGALVATADGELRRISWDGVEAKRFERQPAAVTVLVIGVDGRWIAGSQGRAGLWDAEAAQPVTVWSVEGTVRAAAWIDDDRWAMATSAGELRVDRFVGGRAEAEWVSARHRFVRWGLLPIGGRSLLDAGGRLGVRRWELDLEALRARADRLVAPDRDGDAARRVLEQK